MKKIKILSVVAITLTALLFTAFKPISGKLVSKNTHISFFSHTSLEDITANNYKVISTLDTNTGDIVFSVPMQSFEFEKALMQKHFNSSKFLDTKKYPKAKFIGTITNLEGVDFNKDGVYDVTVSGNLTIKEKTNSFNEKANIKGGKPSTNVAKEVVASVTAIYETE